MGPSSMGIGMGHLSRGITPSFFAASRDKCVEQPTGTIELLNLGCPTGRCSRNRSHEINGFESLRLSGLGTHIFALTHLVVNRAVVSSCRWLIPFEAWSLHPAMFRRIHSLGCPSSTAWLLVRLRMNVLMHISLHLRILVVIFNPCCRHQGHSKETNIWKKNTRKKTYTFLVCQLLFDHQKTYPFAQERWPHC